jgi:glycosyltransferase involved in cell wall biosynthesis
VRICLVSNLYPPHVIGGAELIVADIARGLQDIGHDVVVVSTARRDAACTETQDGIRVHRLPPANLYWAGDARGRPPALKPLWHTIDLWNPRMYTALRAILARERFDVVHTHNLGGLSPAVWSAAAATGVPIIHTTHDYSLTCVRSLRMTPDERICGTQCASCAVRGSWLRSQSRRVAGVLAPSQFVLDRHLELGFFPNAATSVTRWGLRELPPPRPVPPSPPVRFLFIGLLRAHKGVRVMLEAFRRATGDTVRLDIAGTGELAEECRAAAAADPRIRMHGWVAGDAKRRLLEAAHVLLAPSISWEVSGLAILEAFGHGIPAIGARIGGIPELIDDDETGYLVAPGDATALAGRIQTLAATPSLLSRLGVACRARAERLPLSGTVRDIVELYERVRTVGVPSLS